MKKGSFFLWIKSEKIAESAFSYVHLKVLEKQKRRFDSIPYK